MVATSSKSGAVIDTQLPGECGPDRGDLFERRGKVHQDFTGNPEFVMQAPRLPGKGGDDAHMLDDLLQALIMLQQRLPEGRPIILMIAEKRDRSKLSWTTRWSSGQKRIKVQMQHAQLMTKGEDLKRPWRSGSDTSNADNGGRILFVLRPSTAIFRPDSIDLRSGTSSNPSLSPAPHCCRRESRS
jgi:hypothetical protein